MAAQTIGALTAGRDGTNQHTITNTIAGQALAEFVNHTDRFVADHKPRADFVFTLQDMDISAANRRERNTDDRFTNAGSGNRYGFDGDLIRPVKNQGPHYRRRFHGVWDR